MIVIYHNSRCGTSRVTLSLIKSTGADPVIVDYLKAGWTEGHLLGLFAAAGLTPREALRAKEAKAKELGLHEEGVPAADILAAMVAHPVLVNRPFVCTKKGVRLCRPSETVLTLLDGPFKGPVTRENGEMLIDGDGRPVV
nr:arsenate reductase (glutaredoxin) [Parvularcula bermudensis]